MSHKEQLELEIEEYNGLVNELAEKENERLIRLGRIQVLTEVLKNSDDATTEESSAD